MEKIRTEITSENLKFINSNNISLTRVVNKLLELMRIEDAHIGVENELQKNLQRIIRESKK
jgi:UV DNA damage repair endonuclease